MSQVPDGDTLFRWINDLDAATPQRRAAAERALLDHAEAARELLRKALALEERPLIAAQAALLLGRMGDRASVPALVRASQSSARPDLRVILLRAATELADPASVDAETRSRLEALREESDPALVGWARRALDRIAPAFDVAVGAEDLQRLADLAGDPLGGALRAHALDLGSEIRPQRQQAERALLDAGRRAHAPLIEALGHPSASVRAGAARLLTQIPTPDATGALLALAAAEAGTPREQDLRALALRSLGACLVGVEAHIVDDLAALGRDPDRFVRAAAASALGRLVFPEAAAALASLLDDADPFVVEEAAASLGRIGVTAAQLPEVLRALRGPVARAHAGLLRALQGPLSAELGRDPEARLAALSALWPQLGAGEPQRVTAALAALSRLHEGHPPPGRAELERVLALVSHPDPDVTRAALATLAPWAQTQPGLAQAAATRAAHRDEPSVAALIELLAPP